MMGPFSYRLLTATAISIALATGPPLIAGDASPVEATRVHEDNFRLLSLRLGRLTLADSLEAYTTPGDGLCLDLQQTVDALDFPIRVNAGNGTANGWFRAESSVFALDRSKHHVRAGGRDESVRTRDVLTSPTGLCVDTAALARWFDLELTPDLPNALLVAKSETKLPVELAEERKQRQARLRPAEERALDTFPRARSPYALWRTPALDLVADAGFIDDKVRNESRMTGRYELYASGEAARMSFDARFASNTRAEPESLRLRAYRKSVDADLLGALKATEVAFGDVVSYASSLSSENSYGRGAYISNQPLDRPQTFDRTELRGELPAGWDAELYRNGQLIAFSDSRADGRYEFLNVPLLFGNNRFEVRLYGPQGQERAETRTVNVGMDSIPAGKTYYWAGVLQDEKDVLTLRDIPRVRDGHPMRGAAVIERGIGKRTSVALQLHTLVPNDDERLTYVEGSVRQIVGPALIQLDLASDFEGGVAIGGQMIAQYKNTYLTAQTLFADNFVSDRVDPGLNSQHSLALDHYFDIGAQTIPVGVKLAYKDWTAPRSDTLDVAARISARLAGLSLTQEVAWQHISGVRGAGGDDYMTGTTLVGGRVGSVRLRGEARYRLQPTSELESISLAAERALDDRSIVRADLAYETFTDRVRFGAGYSRRFDRLALGLRAEAASDGSLAAGLNLAMSFGPNTRGKRPRMTATKLASTGQAGARVFTDRNRDGIWQEDEPLHKGVTIAAGTAHADRPTDESGTTVVDGLRAFQPQLLSLDASTLADPLLKPAVRGIVVVPRPGIIMPVDFALLPTGEVEGMLYYDSGKGADALPGADLELVDKDGTVIAHVRSDFDGFFLFQDIVYGDYALRIGTATASALGLPQQTLKTVHIGDAEPIVRAGSVTLIQPLAALTIADAAPDDSVAYGGTLVRRILR